MIERCDVNFSVVGRIIRDAGDIDDSLAGLAPVGVPATTPVPETRFAELVAKPGLLDYWVNHVWPDAWPVGR